MVFFRAGFELEPGAIGQRTDFKEANKKLEWGLKKVKSFYRCFEKVLPSNNSIIW